MRCHWWDYLFLLVYFGNRRVEKILNYFAGGFTPSLRMAYHHTISVLRTLFSNPAIPLSFVLPFLVKMFQVCSLNMIWSFFCLLPPKHCLEGYYFYLDYFFHIGWKFKCKTNLLKLVLYMHAFSPLRSFLMGR